MTYVIAQPCVDAEFFDGVGAPRGAAALGPLDRDPRLVTEMPPPCTAQR
ncbi:MAG TPA: hypothetical protein VFU73_08375 [Actinocrinis sp.]|nr:hypothetical protein [Actinocrinis sp.]